MKNIDKLIQNLQECMLNNQSDYIDSIINTLIENEHDYRSVAFKNKFYKYPNTFFDLNIAIDNLLKARKEKNFMRFAGSIICFQFSSNPSLTSQQYVEYLDKINPYEPANREQYQAMNEKYDLYKGLSNFNLFEDIILPNEEAEKYTKFKTVSFEVDNWCNYCFQVIRLFRPEYDDKFSIKRYKRLTRQITQNVSLMLHYDDNLLHRVLKRGTLDLPDLSLSLLIRNESIGKRDSLNNFTQIEMGNAYNYFFDLPVTQPDKLFINTKVIKDSEGGYKILDLIKRQKIDDSHTRLYHECAIEEDLKFQAFYYFDLEAYFSKIYLKYIEDCILKVEGK